MGLHRTAEEWSEHPEGQHLAKVPVIEIIKINDTEPIPFKPNPVRPLSGIKALSCTHVIAGTTAARTLAESGAEILHIARDQSFEHEILVTEVNVGMRSSFVDLKKPAQKQLSRHSFRMQMCSSRDSAAGQWRGWASASRKLRRRSPASFTARYAATVGTVPGRNGRGFDMEALTVSGYTIKEAGGDLGRRPSFPPTMVLNDFIAGYMGAAGIIAALRRRAKEGGSYHVRISLTRAAMWFMSLGSFPTTTDFDPNDPEHRMIDPRRSRDRLLTARFIAWRRR